MGLGGCSVGSDDADVVAVKGRRPTAEDQLVWIMGDVGDLGIGVAVEGATVHATNCDEHVQLVVIGDDRVDLVGRGPRESGIKISVGPEVVEDDVELAAAGHRTNGGEELVPHGRPSSVVVHRYWRRPGRPAIRRPEDKNVRIAAIPRGDALAPLDSDHHGLAGGVGRVGGDGGQGGHAEQQGLGVSGDASNCPHPGRLAKAPATVGGLDEEDLVGKAGRRRRVDPGHVHRAGGSYADGRALVEQAAPVPLPVNAEGLEPIR